MLTVARRFWVPLVIVVAVAVAALVVDRLHGASGKAQINHLGSGIADDSKPFNPKQVTYEIYARGPNVATINYLDLGAHPQEVRNTPLPWTITLTTTAGSASANVVAQGDGNDIGCRIVVNGKVRDEKSSDGVHAETFCLVTAA
jgi:hypothetical protein